MPIAPSHRRLTHVRQTWLVPLLLLFGALSSTELAAQGIVAGVVRKEDGEPLAGVRVSILREIGSIAVLTASDGRFLLEGVPSGPQAFEASKRGYRTAQARITVPQDSALVVNITLVAEAQRLPGVVIEADFRNSVGGVVLDSANQPVAGVVVEVIGQGNRMTTGEDGRFIFTDLDPGLYLMQWRKAGYAVAQTSVRMVNKLERDFAVRLKPLGTDWRSPEAAAVIAHETNRRLGLRGGRAKVVGRDELERFGMTRLDVALRGSSAMDAYLNTPSKCVLVNGYEGLTTGGDGALSRTLRGPRGPQSIDPSGTAPRTRPVNLANPVSWLSYFRANEVEMVELYPEGTEHSRTLCGRFPPSTGCACPPDPAGIVIWLR